MSVSHLGSWHTEFDCQNPECKKHIVVPWGSNSEEYGYWYGGKRCCSYSCMRKLEKKYASPFAAYDGKQLNAIKKRNEKFTKLEKFMELMITEGVKPDEAAIEAGFPNIATAVNCRYRWWNTPIWKEWKKAKEEGRELLVV